MPPARTNRLADEKSPYLLKHAHNPVDWWSWGKEALAKAKNDNKPIFLSIGYSTCHWCTVMERESFEDEKTAAFINKNFIPIKVDREERPEVDAYYMTAVQAITGGGGWPLSVFLTPDLKAFYGGTYFPPEPRYGSPSFMQVLQFVATLWKDKKEEVLTNTEQIQKALEEQSASAPQELRKEALAEGYADLVSSLDPANGGFGSAPKFPLPNSLRFLLRYHFRTGNELALSAVVKTLDHMMSGGIRDHVGGGFHRYSTDRVWLVPHFEKMLYDNALLAQTYTEAHQVTGKKEYAATAREALRWMSDEMQGPEGGFYSAQDADTAEGEGSFYSWTPEEVASVLGDEGPAFCELYGVTETGNFDGRSLLHLDPGGRVALELAPRVPRWKKSLRSARMKRPRPATDDKVLTSWNGLAISAFAYAGAAFGDPELVENARRSAKFVLGRRQEDGGLYRRFAGGEAALAGTLEDYAFLLQGLLDLFEADPDPRWLEESLGLADFMVRYLEDADEGGFYLTRDPEPVRLKESYDGPTPSGNSVAVGALIRLAELTGKQEYRVHAQKALKAFSGKLGKSPSSHTAMLSALDLELNGAREVVLTAPSLDAAKPMLDVVRTKFLPDKVLLVATDENHRALGRASGLLEARAPGAKPRAYVCVASTCKRPAETAEALAAQLAPR